MRQVYLLPGRGEELGGDLGQLLLSMGYHIEGRGLVPPFSGERFADQQALIKEDLSGYWLPEAVLIGRSYGAYLLLHTLIDMAPFPGRILLLSPVLGVGFAADGFYGSYPPRASKLLDIAEGGSFPVPGYLEIHTGDQDPGCDPQLATLFSAYVHGTKLHFVAGEGHGLPKDYTCGVVRGFLDLAAQA